LVIVLGDTDKLDNFRRLDRLTRADEEDRDPVADSSAALSQERKISASLGGRTVFDGRRSKKPADQGEKKQAFYIRFLADGFSTNGTKKHAEARQRERTHEATRLSGSERSGPTTGCEAA
jgi:hypothetical protein